MRVEISRSFTIPLGWVTIGKRQLGLHMMNLVVTLRKTPRITWQQSMLHSLQLRSADLVGWRSSSALSLSGPRAKRACVSIKCFDFPFKDLFFFHALVFCFCFCFFSPFQVFEEILLCGASICCLFSHGAIYSGDFFFARVPCKLLSNVVYGPLRLVREAAFDCRVIYVAIHLSFSPFY